jgi:hypothetical protein
MGATFSRIKTWTSEILTATDLNAEFNNILNNLTPAGTDDASATLSDMQTIVDPTGGSLATSLAGELQRLRYMIKAISGGAYWYSTPSAIAADTVDGFHATATPTAGKVPVADGSGKLDSWVTTVTVPAFHATMGGGTQSLSDDTWTKIVFDTEVFDTATCYDPTTNYRFVPNVAGKYLVIVQVGFDTTVDGISVGAGIWQNGAQTQSMINTLSNPAAANKKPFASCSAIIAFNGTTDYVEGWAYQFSGGAKDLDGNAIKTFFCASKVG